MSEESVIQVHIPADQEYEQIDGYEVEVDEIEYNVQQDTMSILLSTGGDISYLEDEPFTIQMEGNYQRVVIPDKNTAYAYYLHGLETHSIPEMTALENISGRLGDYVDWQNSLTKRDRKLRLMDLADWRIEYEDFATERYFEKGAIWRETGLDKSGEKLAEQIVRNVGFKPSMCYWTAQNAAIKYIDNHRVTYAEGLVLPKQASQCIKHAWIEIDGKVAEITWPWHFFDGKDAVYFGVEIDKETVKETRQRRDINGQIVLSDEEIPKIGLRQRDE